MTAAEEVVLPRDLVVFIDDDEGPMELYQKALEDEGYKVERFTSLIAALAYTRTTSDRPALWLVDVMMPIEDASVVIDGQPLMTAAAMGLASGRVLFGEIRKRFPETPVILLTNVATPDILNVIEAAMDHNSWCESKMMFAPSKLVELVAEKIKASKPAA